MAIELEENRVSTIFKAPLVYLFIGVFLFIALLYRQNDLALLTFLILGVVTAAKIWSIMSHYRLRYAIRVDKQRAFPGETLAVETFVENAKLLPVRIRIHWSLNLSLKLIGGEEPTFRQEAGLLWYQRVQLHSDVVARSRGVYHVGPNCIRAGDLLGFFEKEKKSRKTATIIVYPRLVCLKSIDLPMRELFGVPGVKSPVQDPVYILGTRDYQPSRPSRHIHWKASARHLKLQEKVFEPSEQEKVLLALEVGPFQKSMARDAFESTLEVIASLSLQLHDKGCAVGLVTNGALTGGGSSILTPTRAPGQLTALLEALARLQLAQYSALEPIMRRSLSARRGVSCAYFSYKAGRAEVEMQKYCRQHNIPITFFLCCYDPIRDAVLSKHSAGMHALDEIRIQENEST
jgi:uncharacterized protein (DUF58 family)